MQSVGFRYFCQVEAVLLGITGYARNTADGSVEIEAQGDANALKRFEEAVSRGPRSAHVSGLSREELAVKQLEYEFTIR